MTNSNEIVATRQRTNGVSRFAKIAAFGERLSAGRYVGRLEAKPEDLSGGSVERPVADLALAIFHVLHDRGRMQQMILTYRSKLRDGAHGPEVVADVVAVAVIEPVRIGIIQPTAGDPAIRRCEICGVVQRAEGIFAGLAVPTSRNTSR